jgi:hypothetical protein
VLATVRGGAELLRRAASTGRTFDNLVTIDPVDLPLHDLSPDLRINNVRNWINVTANPAEWDDSDRIASLGGKVSEELTNRAGVRRSSSAHHREFDVMMREANADRVFTNSYRYRTGRRR